MEKIKYFGGFLTLLLLVCLLCWFTNKTTTTTSKDSTETIVNDSLEVVIVYYHRVPVDTIYYNQPYSCDYDSFVIKYTKIPVTKTISSSNDSVPIGEGYEDSPTYP